MVYFEQISSAFLLKAKEILSYLNWVDLLGILIVIRTLYMGFRKGMLIEIFKILGLGAGIFVAVTQSRKWGMLLSEETLLPRRGMELLAFGACFLAVYWLVSAARFFFAKRVMTQDRSVWDRLGGGTLGFCRGCLWLIVLQVSVLSLAPATGYVARSIQDKSFFGPSLLTGGKATYQMTHRAASSFTVEQFEKMLQKDGFRR